ncbi:MAG: PmoA family protein [Gemmataceae bacterium]
MRPIAYALLLGFGFASGAEAQPKVDFKTEPGRVDLLLDGKLATRYLTGADVPKPIFWPVLAGGVPVTRAWPMDTSIKGESTDHPHQKSFWFCHGDVIPVGKTPKAKIKGIEGVDFWSVAKGHGDIRLKSMKGPMKSGNEVILDTENEWLGGKLLVLKEHRVMTFRPAPGGWLIVFKIDLTAPDHAVIFGDTKEGALGLRINDQMRADKVGNGQIRIPGKKGEKDCWGQKAPWCDYAGAVDGKKVGVTVFAAPSNPQPTCWHVRGYGLMAANPFGRWEKAKFPGAKGEKELVRLEPGQTLTLRYAVHVYEGERSEPVIASLATQLWK